MNKIWWIFSVCVLSVLNGTSIEYIIIIIIEEIKVAHK